MEFKLTSQTFNAEQLVNIKRIAHNLIKQAPDLREATIFKATIEAVLIELQRAEKLDVKK
jgi:hypothetical protein